MKIVFLLSCLCLGNGELEYENISVIKLEKINFSIDVNFVVFLSWKDF